MTKTQINILQSVFGYVSHAGNISGKPLRLHKSMKREIIAARQLADIGIVIITQDPEMENVIVVKSVSQS